MEDIKAKLDLLELSEKERKFAIEKFLVSLSEVTYDDLKKIVDFLKEKGIHLTKAREIKILANDYNDIIKNFSIIESVNELGLYREDPLRINKNALDIFKKIKYCIQVGKPYKKEDGSYEKFLFSEAEWQKVFNLNSESVTVSSPSKTETVTSEDTTEYSNDFDYAAFSINDEDIVTVVPPRDEVQSETVDATRDLDLSSVSAKRKELEGLKENLKESFESQFVNFDSSLNDDPMISFDDIEPETYRR